MNTAPEISCTYASLGSTGVFDRNANESHMLMTPFAQPSWEPRFAVDSRWLEVESITRCLEFFLGQSHHPNDNPTLDIYESNKARLAITRHGGWGAGFQDRGRELARNVEVAPAALLIYQFLLEEADYPPQPWFDGGEDKGFQAFDVPYKAHPLKLYGFLIIEPKWFECHK